MTVINVTTMPFLLALHKTLHLSFTVKSGGWPMGLKSWTISIVSGTVFSYFCFLENYFVSRFQVKIAFLYFLKNLKNGGFQHCVKSVRIRSFSDPYSVRMRESTDQKNSEYVFFSRSTKGKNKETLAYNGLSAWLQGFKVIHEYLEINYLKGERTLIK